MEVTSGVPNVAREVTIDSHATAAEVASAIEEALAPGGVLRLTDARGRETFVPGSAIGWVQVGESEKGRVGFHNV